MRPDRLAPWIQLALVAACVAVYAPVFGFGFVDLDDPRYVTENPWVLEGLTLEGLWRAFSGVELSNWHPLTWISHMLDVSLFGLDAGWHHAENVALHAANACLLFALLARMTGARAPGARLADLLCCAWVAGVFALHPTRVESVAWISERKDVLSTFFGLLALAAWLRQLEAPSPRRYALAAGLLVLSLMAKPTLVTFPFLLLLLDLWPLARLGDPPTLGAALRLVREKLPLLAVVAVASGVAVAAQWTGGALQSVERVPLGERLASLPIAYVHYLRMAFWPTELAVFYPRFAPEQVAAGPVLAASALLLALTALALWPWRARPMLAVGWLWFLGTLVPTIGLVQVGDQSHADRYTYLPLVGLAIAVAWGVRSVWPRALAPALAAAALAALVAFSLVARVQVGSFRDGFTLWERALAVTRDNAVTRTHLTTLHLGARQLDLALKHAQRAAELAPEMPVVHHNLGRVYTRTGARDRALAAFQRALAADPDFAPSRLNLANQLRERGRYAEAVQAFDRALRAEPGLWDVPRIEEAYALALHAQLASGQRSFEDAAADYRRALDANGDFQRARNDLAWLLATHPQATPEHGAEALRLAQALVNDGAPSASHLDTLAAARAAVGDFEGAVRAAERAAALAAEERQPVLAARIEARAAAYRSGARHRDPSLAGSAP